MLGFTFVTFWNEWQEAHSVKSSNLVELRGDTLIFKVPISIPYQSEWEAKPTEERMAIFDGEFYHSYKQAYQNDTLYTYYTHQRVSRENIYTLLHDVHDNLNQFSKKNIPPAQKSLDFFKNLSKDYVEIHTRLITLFWVEDLPIQNYAYSSDYVQIPLEVSSPPPVFS
ncbi:MAG: hypothetical protein ACK4NY_20460 [Spirosomataceae bacterium]